MKARVCHATSIQLELGSMGEHFETRLAIRQNDFALPLVPKYRSGLACGAGFLGLACVISRYSLIPLLFELKHNQVISDTLFLLALPLPGIPALFALWLGLAAFSDLKRHRNKSGWLPASVGLVIGLLGTLILLFESYEVVRALLIY